LFIKQNEVKYCILKTSLNFSLSLKIGLVAAVFDKFSRAKLADPNLTCSCAHSPRLSLFPALCCPIPISPFIIIFNLTQPRCVDLLGKNIPLRAPNFNGNDSSLWWERSTIKQRSTHLRRRCTGKRRPNAPYFLLPRPLRLSIRRRFLLIFLPWRYNRGFDSA
jgi:hypothetical protein